MADVMGRNALETLPDGSVQVAGTRERIVSKTAPVANEMTDAKRRLARSAADQIA
jgi:hypothetical protein